jgi:hypothetical protein
VNRDDDPQADRFAWAVVWVVAVASLITLGLLAGNRWPT